MRSVRQFVTRALPQTVTAAIEPSNIKALAEWSI